MGRATRPAWEAGFSLLEVMVALAVVAISFLALFELRNLDIGRTMFSGHVTTATLLAQERLTALELSGRLGTGEWSGVFPGYEKFAWKAQVRPTTLAFVREVRLLVFWAEGRRTEQVELITYVFEER
jgi:general secretion pathway protein I